MKKLLLGALMVMGVFGTAQASELYWMIADNAELDGSELGTWDTAYIYASVDGSNFRGEFIEEWTKSDMSIWDGYAVTGIGEYDAAKSFYIELYDAGSKIGQSVVSMSDPKQGATLASTLEAAGAIDIGGGANMPSPYSFTTFTTSEVVPEPTTGLLMLFGLAGLALRRRRA